MTQMALSPFNREKRPKAPSGPSVGLQSGQRFGGMFDMLRAGDILVVRWVTGLGATCRRGGRCTVYRRADSDEVAQAFRNDVARRYEMKPPSVPT